jgi:hypothetical protein
MTAVSWKRTITSALTESLIKAERIPFNFGTHIKGKRPKAFAEKQTAFDQIGDKLSAAKTRETRK